MQKAPNSNTNSGCGICRSLLTVPCITQGSFPQQPVPGVGSHTLFFQHFYFTCHTSVSVWYHLTLQPGGYQTTMASLKPPGEQNNSVFLSLLLGHTGSPIHASQGFPRSLAGHGGLLSSVHLLNKSFSFWRTSVALVSVKGRRPTSLHTLRPHRGLSHSPSAQA